MPSLARRAVAELIGTAILVFFGCSAIIMEPFPGAHFGVFGVAMVHAIALAIAVTITMNISGGHCNPAVTLGLLSIRRISGGDAFIYVVSQLAGALVAAALVRATMPANVGGLATIAYGTPMINGQLSVMQAIGIEAVLAFLLMSAVMGTAVAANAPRVAGFGIGLALIPIIMVGGPLTGGVVNPARAFGPAVISGTFVSQAIWWIGPIVGAVIAAMVWQHGLLRGEPVVVEETVIVEQTIV